ncbi:flagellar assembly protein FliW [[Clostridium] polysaccharolyticum]|uniref:Flagellar assembly factor FliW n=1 Tax=[Clostridium] polysaccharolyticum TaxID=29364 RepID=A0A1I0CTR4_9FIRM|nr:flagellar assembly protein FliW [[Clostridium] polysaccharolyticum]SET23204.1 flagellar assembly factor FliW [[Clostridium] polysaccharolyticum]
MLIKTRCFGEVEISDDKIVEFPEGILGFEELKRYTLIYDVKENGEKAKIAWLQAVDEPELALPVINPFEVKKDYDPVINETLMKDLGDVNSENAVVLLVVTVPSDITKTTANLKAPIIINSDIRVGAQLIAENRNYVVKYPIIKNDDKGEK